MAFEAQFSKEEISTLLEELHKISLISYDFKKNSIWIKGKIKHHKNTFSTYESCKSISLDLDEFKNCCFYQSIFEKYPELIDLALTLETLKQRRYKTKEQEVV